jgi:photosystem II stability/assembly factor-like uncharacterized protein
MQNIAPRARRRARWASLSVSAICLCAALSLLYLPAPGRATFAQEQATRHWEPLGPNRIALWSFSPAYEEDGLILIATAATEKQSLRGVYRSPDRGDTWADSSEGLTPKKRHYYTALKFSPTVAEDGTVWLFGHKTGLGRTEAFGGFWESTDSGVTWSEVGYEGFPFRKMTQRVSQDIIGVVISPHIAEDGLMVAAAGGEGVYVSRDAGRTWELLNPIKDVVNIYAPPTFPEEPFLALATTGSQIMISTDGGETFETKGNGLPEMMKAVRDVAFSPNFSQDRKMFCQGAAGIFGTDDAGESWHALALSEETASVEAMAVTGDFVEVGAIAYGTDDAQVFLSEDMGQTFQSIEAETLLSYKVDTIAFPPDYWTSRQLYVSSQDGIFRYGPAENLAAEATAEARVADVDATRVARATTVSEMEFVPEQSDRVETGCIAYIIGPALLVLGSLMRLRR